MSTISSARRVLLVDGAITAALWLALALPLARTNVFTLRFGGNLNSPGALLLSTAIILPLIWRRHRTVDAAVVMAVVCVAQLAAGVPALPANLAVLLMLYTLASVGPRWASWGGLILAVVAAPLASIQLSVRNGVDPGTVIVILVASATIVVLPWLLGRLTRANRRSLEQARDRADRLEREQAQERALAQAEERTRIAREMHDIVAHSLSVMIAQADGGRYAAPAHPEAAVAALEAIAEQGRDALGEMRRLLDIQRTEHDGDTVETRPTPGIADIQAQVDSARNAGLSVQFEVHGQPRRALPAGAELAAYRVVQESLTNAIKHAGPAAAVQLAVRWRSDGLEIDVVDDGRGAASRVMDRPASAEAGAHSAGHGLRGMRERVAMYGGVFAAGPRSGGGFRVRADIPYEET